ncbi:MAG: DUF4128 domain-containing protein [Pseudomonadales bacterium]|jgi:hypothetical protein|nr:DUF4128 domain-containing protein [Pseudomonadales bacterium]
MSQQRIRSAFEDRLASWAAARLLPVVWQNAGAELPTTDHLRAYLLPAETTSRDLAGDMRSYRGVFQVSVFTEPGQGPNRAEQLARELDELFPVALLMPSGGLNVMVLSPMSAMPALQESDWFSIPCQCRYGAEEVIQ